MKLIQRRQFLGLTVAACTLGIDSVAVLGAPRAKHVFIISYDGGKPPVMRRSPMPLTLAMAQQGAATWKASTVVPSITLVSHTSMLTGVQPSKHRIWWNDWIPGKGTVKVPTVFSLARAKGYRTALFAGKAKFRHLKLPGSLDNFEVPGYEASKVARAAATVIVARKPNLCFVHFADGDGAGHASGWGSSQQVKAFAATDAALEIVRAAVKKAGIEKDSVFILTADHGGHAKTHGTTAPDDMIIPWVAWGKGVRPKLKIAAQVNTCDTAATALWLLGVPIPSSFDGQPVRSAFG